MRKLRYNIFLVTFLFIALISYGQSKQKKIPENKQGIEINLDSLLKFNPREQILKDLEKDDTIRKEIVEIYWEIPKHYRSEKEMNLLLQKYKLNNDSVFYYGTDNEDPESIWKKIDKLRNRIDKKFGVNFIDSLRNIAEKQYVLNNIDKVFEYEECDTISRYSGAKYYVGFSKIYVMDFWKVVKYPTDFKYRNEKDLYSYMRAEFVLHKNGKVSDIETGVTFQNDQNNKYSTYFRKKLFKFIKKSKWIPAKSAGITVTSKVPLTIHFK